jgi:hypothetical protein
MDNDQYDFQYYIDLHNYYKQLEEYEDKLERFHAGDTEVFKREEIIIPFGKESFDLSSEALAELDEYQYDFDYYTDLRDYNTQIQEYNKKRELFNAGYKDVFNEKEIIIPLKQKNTISFGRESYELSADALAFSDNYQYEPDYYTELCNYYREIQEYEHKLELFNAGQDVFKTENNITVFSKESSELSAKALAHADGEQYNFEYYVQLHDYYKELENYNRNLELFQRGHKDIFKESDKIGRYIDKAELSVNMETQKIWVPPLKDLIAFSRGKLPFYFLETLLYMFNSSSEESFDENNIEISMKCNTGIINEIEFDELRKDIRNKMMQINR